MAEFRCEYKYTSSCVVYLHDWTLVGAKGGLHLHLTESREKAGRFEAGHVDGVIEIHYRNPPEYMKNQCPNRDECWLLKCPCWHDGSSAEVHTRWIPIWQSGKYDHESMFMNLCSRARELFLSISDAL